MLQEFFAHSDSRIPDCKPVPYISWCLYRRSFICQKRYAPAGRCKFNRISQQVDQNLIDPQSITVKGSMENILCINGQ